MLNDDEEDAKSLLARGALVNLQSKQSGDTALHMASKHDFHRLLELLLNAVCNKFQYGVHLGEGL